MTYQPIISCSSGLDDIITKKNQDIVVDGTVGSVVCPSITKQKKQPNRMAGTAKVEIPPIENDDEHPSLLPRPRRRVHFAPSCNLETIHMLSCIDDMTLISSSELWWQRHELKEFMARIQNCVEKLKSQSTKRMWTRSDDNECLLGVERYEPSRLSKRKQAIGIVLAGQKQPQHRSDPTFLWRVSKRCSLQSRLNAAKMGNDLFQELLREDEHMDESNDTGSSSPAKKRRRV